MCNGIYNAIHIHEHSPPINTMDSNYFWVCLLFLMHLRFFEMNYNCHRAVDSFSNPGVLLEIDCLSLFSEPRNSGGALAPPAPLLSIARNCNMKLKKCLGKMQAHENQNATKEIFPLNCDNMTEDVLLSVLPWDPIVPSKYKNGQTTYWCMIIQSCAY